MAFQELTQANAFSPGAELWVIPDLEVSDLSRKINWYLNFQLVKALPYSAPPLHKELVEIVEACELPLRKKTLKEKPPLLIGSSNQLPNKWTALIPIEEPIADWFTQCYKIWKDLHTQSLRFFLPPTLSSTDFKKLWQKKVKDDASVSYVSSASFNTNPRT